MRVVVTGGEGFIGQNLRLRLTELGYESARVVTRRTTKDELRAALETAEFVFHLAGVNRPSDDAEFQLVNVDFTAGLCSILRELGRSVPLLYASSTQATLDNPYGASKRDAEAVVERYGIDTSSPTYVMRLPNVFGKWSRPNYNSAIATFCHNLTRGLPISVSDPNSLLSLAYIDDVVSSMVELLHGGGRPGRVGVGPVYETSLGEVVAILELCSEARHTLVVPHTGAGLVRALYATFLSFLRPEDFAYGVRRNSDRRGVFVEMIKTLDSGQVSYLTVAPGVTRGEHYHHTKTEKFLVVRGKARFGFRHMLTNEVHEIVVEDRSPRIVETIPGWVHDITNVGESEVVVILWANEMFDPARPDTVLAKVRS